ncbi:AI-2E family transporter [Frateuria aurantia]
MSPSPGRSPTASSSLVVRPGPSSRPPQPPEPRGQAAIRRLLLALLTLALLYTIALVKGLLIPLVLAAFIGLALNPLVAWAARHRIPRAASASALVLLLVAVTMAAISALIEPTLRWFHTLPAAIHNFAPYLRPMTRQLDAASRVTMSLVAPSGSREVIRHPAAAAISAWDLIAAAPRIMAVILTVLMLTVFFLSYGEQLLRRLIQNTPGFARQRGVVSVVRDIQAEISRYMLITSMINFLLGLLTTAWLWLLHVPDAMLWGTVAMLANFIPYVGAVTTTVMLGLVGLINFDAIALAVLPALGFALMTGLEGNVLTPLIVGRQMRLSPIAILVWLLIWGWLWGIPGALLAVPMLTCLKLIAARLPGWRWFAVMVSH